MLSSIISILLHIFFFLGIGCAILLPFLYGGIGLGYLLSSIFDINENNAVVLCGFLGFCIGIVIILFMTKELSFTKLVKGASSGGDPNKEVKEKQLYDIKIWEIMVRNVKLESELREYIKKHRNEAIDEINAIYAEIGIERDTHLLSTDEKEEGVMLLMAKRGYLPWKITYSGYTSQYAHLRGIVWFDEAPKIMLWVTKQLKARGVNDDVYGLEHGEKMLYKVGSHAFNVRKEFITKYIWTSQATIIHRPRYGEEYNQS